MRGEAEVDKLQVGDLTTVKLPVIVLDHPVLKALEDMTGRHLDGLMGFTFFARYKTTIDYHAHDDVRADRISGPRLAQRASRPPDGPQGHPSEGTCALGLWGLRLGEPTGGLIHPVCRSLRSMAGPRPLGLDSNWAMC